jgi:hypothetical protein
VQVIAETGGDHQVEFRFPGLVPGDVADSAFPDVLVDPVGEDGAAGLGAVELDPGVVQGGEDVGDPGGRGDAVDHEKHVQAGVRRSPSRGQRQGSGGAVVLLGGHKSQSLLSGPGSHKVRWWSGCGHSHGTYPVGPQGHRRPSPPGRLDLP